MLKDWFDQMFIGFKIGHPLSSFDKQLAFYRKKMLEVQFHVKIAKLSMQRYKEKISEKTNTRVKMERWEQARMTKIAD